MNNFLVYLLYIHSRLSRARMHPSVQTYERTQPRIYACLIMYVRAHVRTYVVTFTLPTRPDTDNTVR